MSNKKRINKKISVIAENKRLKNLRKGAMLLTNMINLSIEFRKRRSNALNAYPVGGIINDNQNEILTGCNGEEKVIPKFNIKSDPGYATYNYNPDKIKNPQTLEMKDHMIDAFKYLSESFPLTTDKNLFIN